ncbi:hypothetical protein Purlil1_12929 [Purpureocillium lilacinum]|uniref:Uncharacterized protein n=1 Tax=Purpureocillium lilacinum TaxID=33203 RepID=A0ABR0BFK1_PURLI|nr:hypothetical protein Purlil1_12929 [Purpureocillium lilacinum]
MRKSGFNSSGLCDTACSLSVSALTLADRSRTCTPARTQTRLLYAQAIPRRLHARRPDDQPTAAGPFDVWMHNTEDVAVKWADGRSDCASPARFASTVLSTALISTISALVRPLPEFIVHFLLISRTLLLSKVAVMLIHFPLLLLSQLAPWI